MKNITILGKEKIILSARNNQNLLKLLLENGIYVNSPCGGMSLCNKCLVWWVEKEEFIKACLHLIEEDMTIKVEELSGFGITSIIDDNYDIESRQGYGIALDLGTTTLAFYLLDLTNGNILKSKSLLNKQISFGADVITRIEQCVRDNLDKLHSILIEEINSVIIEFKTEFNIKTISSIVASGNPTMIHILANVNPQSIGFAPYTPVFLDSRTYSGKELGINVEEVLLTPHISAFVGSDIVMGMIASGMLEDKYSLLIDLGTNGEIVLKKANEFFATSTAAGPTFEGANIELGMGGVKGAINKVEFVDSTYKYSTVSGVPLGISGSGLVDLVALLLKNGLIDETGHMADSIKNNRFYLTDKIYISQKDIRQFQLAKSAIYSGIETLLEVADILPEVVEHIYLAGGFGFYLNLENTFASGLLPLEFKGKVKSIGNASGAGSISVLLKPDLIELASKIKTKVKTIDLANNPKFTNRFMENILFE